MQLERVLVEIRRAEHLIFTVSSGCCLVPVPVVRAAQLVNVIEFLRAGNAAHNRRGRERERGCGQQ